MIYNIYIRTDTVYHIWFNYVQIVMLQELLFWWDWDGREIFVTAEDLGWRWQNPSSTCAHISFQSITRCAQCADLGSKCRQDGCDLLKRKQEHRFFSKVDKWTLHFFHLENHQLLPSCLQERLYGLSNPQGNHGEDVKDAVPQHERMMYTLYITLISIDPIPFTLVFDECVHRVYVIGDVCISAMFMRILYLEKSLGIYGFGEIAWQVQELYYYLDATPTHSYMKMMYKYPQAWHFNFYLKKEQNVWWKSTYITL